MSGEFLNLQKMNRIVNFVFLALFIASCSNPQNLINSVVSINSGKIEGSFSDSGQIFVFKGIPYAEAPVGALRWKAPQPVDKWEGVKQCKEFSAIAMQGEPIPFWMWTSEFIAPAGNMSEDCLYLNVWTPAKKTDEKLPVMVFIHGGGFTSGSGSVPLYDGTNMAKKGIVFVTINYRVGVFGFFSHPELSAESATRTSGNQGLFDQVAALQWVHNNITAFGGDPDNVTIAGQSAGAFSVNYLLASPLSKGLVHRAIAESGGATMPGGRIAGSITLSDAEKLGLEFQNQLGLGSLEELRNTDAHELQKMQFSAVPIIDGYFLQKSVYETYVTGNQLDVPVISGWNEDEGLGPQSATAQQFINFAKTTYGEKANEFLKVFPANTDEEASASQNKLNALGMFGIQTYHWMLLQNQTGNAPIFVYNFTHDVPYGEGQQNFGAFHSGEIGYAYNNLDKSTVRPWSEADRKLAETMSAYWVNFVKTGNPNCEGLPKWESCKSTNGMVMNFDIDTKSVAFPEKKQLHFLHNLNMNK